jgi:hypothetical protein
MHDRQSNPPLLKLPLHAGSVGQFLSNQLAMFAITTSWHQPLADVLKSQLSFSDADIGWLNAIWHSTFSWY